MQYIGRHLADKEYGKMALGTICSALGLVAMKWNMSNSIRPTKSTSRSSREMRANGVKTA
jgi:hypothetical protein